MIDYKQDPTLLLAAIETAMREHHETDLAEIAISLSGELAAARAENLRLRAALQSSLRALTPARLGAL
jgi:hypothetical protein